MVSSPTQAFSLSCTHERNWGLRDWREVRGGGSGDGWDINIGGTGGGNNVLRLGGLEYTSK
jgi:hypothetical protein